jgi:WD40 repeat protein
MQLNPLPENPFVGLRPFESTESLLFFGRGAQTGELLERLYSRRFVSIVGRSGCGKSSLIRAGLIPKLKAGFLIADRDRWVVATMKPGDRPLHNLAAAVLEATGDDPTAAAFGARVEALIEEVSAEGVEALTERLALVLEERDANFLLLVDQFEEIFRFGARVRGGEEGEEEDVAAVRRRDEAADFVSIMLALAEQRDVPAYVVMTMRSDFLGDCDAFHDLPEAMNQSQYLVPRLSTQQREEAISGPIRLYGGAITPRLLDLVRNDVGDKLDQLPVMQHAMMRTWENWHTDGDGPVDVPDYQSAGTIKSALSSDAEDVLRGMGGEESEERKLTMLVFQALTNTDAENRRIRRPKRLRELEAITGADGKKIMGIVALFQGGGRSFLTVTPDHAGGNHLVDISHESLIRQWKTLREWVDKEAEGRSTYLRIADCAARHKTKGGGLWGDPDLQQALDWWRQRNPTRAWAEQYHPAKKAEAFGKGQSGPALDLYAEAQTFLEESRLARDRELADKERQRKRQLRLTRLITLVVFVGLLVSTGLAVYAMIQKSNADEQAKLARQSEEKANQAKNEALNEARRAEVARGEAEQAAIKERNAKEESLTARASEQQALKTAKENAQRAEAAKVEAQKQARIAKDNATEADKSRRDAETASQAATEQKERAENQVYTSDINIVEDSEEEGDTERSRRILYNYLPESMKNTGSPLYNAHAGQGGPQDRRDFGWFYFWRLNHRDARTLRADEGGVNSVAFSPDGKSLAAAYANGPVKIWNAGNDEISATLEGEQKASALSVAYSPDGKSLAVSSDDGMVRLLDTASNNVRVTLGGLKGPTYKVAYSPDGKRLAAASGDDIKLLDTATGNTVQLSEKSSGSHTAIAFSPDSKTLAIAGAAGVQLWDAVSGQKGAKVTSEPDIYSLVFYPDGIIVGDTRGIVTIFLDNKIKFGSFKAHEGPVISMTLSADGETLATGGSDRTAKLWDVKSGTKLVTLNNDGGIVTSVAFSTDSKTLATGGESGAVKIWDTKLLRGYVEPQQPDKTFIPFVAVAYSREKRMFASLGVTGSIRLWGADAYDQQPRVLKSDGDEAFSAIAFSPKGETLAVGDAGGKTHFFDSTSLKETATPVESLAGNRIASVAYSPDGKLLAISGGDTVVIWDVRARREEWRVNGKAPVAFASTGILAVANDDQIVRLYDVGSKREIGATDTNSGYVNSIAFSPDGTTLAVGSEDKNVRLWDVALIQDKTSLQEAKKPKLLEGHKSNVQALAFSPDGKTLATGGFDKTVRLWSLATRRMLATLKGHTSPVLSVSFSPDGRSLATGEGDGTLKVWRAATDQDVAAQCECGQTGR